MWEQGTVGAETEYYDELRLEWLPLGVLVENTGLLFTPEEAFARLGESRLRGCLCVYNKEEKISLFVDGGLVISATGNHLEGEFAVTRALQLEDSTYQWISGATPLTSDIQLNIKAYTLEHSIARDIRIGSSASQKQRTKTLGLALRDKIVPKTNYCLVSVAQPTMKFYVTKLTNIVGRGRDCDISIDEPNISRKHCLLEISEQNVKIKDLDSRNGISINGVRVAEGTLKVGDQLSLGLYQMVLHEGEKATSQGHDVEKRSLNLEQAFA
jgi:hypothetical protein